MKLSKDTIDILKNYSQINSSISIRKGNHLATMGGENILARATVAEKFPCTISIYDLNQLLSVLSLVQDADVEFGEKSLVVTNNKQSLEYFYADSSYVKGVDDKIKFPIDENHIVFDLTEKELQTILKAAAVLSAPMLSISSKDGMAVVSVNDTKVKATNTYKYEIGPTTSTFDAQLPVENIKVISDAYTVTVCKGKWKLVHFQSKTKQVQYWISIDPDSTV